MYLPQLAMPDCFCCCLVLLCLFLDDPKPIPNIHFQAAFKPLCMFASMWKNTMLPSLRFFFFSLSSLVPFAFIFFKNVYSAKFLLRATANEITLPWESNTLFPMVLPDLMLHKQAVASEKKEHDLPTTWNHLLLQGFSYVFV